MQAFDFPAGTQARLHIVTQKGAEACPFAVFLAVSPRDPTPDAFTEVLDTGAVPVMMLHDAGAAWTSSVELAAISASLRDAGIAVLGFASLGEAMSCRQAIDPAAR